MKKIQVLVLLVLFAFVATQVVVAQEKKVTDKKANTECCEKGKGDAKKAAGECDKADAKKAGECDKADAKKECCDKDKADAKKADVKKTDAKKGSK